MKNLMTISVIVLVYCTMATPSDIAFYVGQWNTDGWYDASQFDDVETIIAETGYLFKDIQQFDDSHLYGFGAWVDERTNDGEMDIIWLNGCTPSVLYPNPNLQPDGSRAEEWLDGGNMIINVGDWFAYCTYERGFRGVDNWDDGAANILDLPPWFIILEDNTRMTVTPTGKKYLPSLHNYVVSDRPVVLSAIEAPWEVAAIFASTDGTEDPTMGIWADPVVLHNTETGGYLAIINQGSYGNRIDDRGLTCAEFIGNWVSKIRGFGDQAQPFATRPNPKDGALYPDTRVTLSWRPGVLAASYDIYFGEHFDDVKDGVVRTFQGNQTATSFSVGFPGGPYPDGLILDTTYYWRIDDVEADGTTIHKGHVWSFTIVDAVTVEYQVSSTEDDGYAYNDEDQNLEFAYLRVGSSGFTQAPYYISGMVFRNVHIPQGAEIISAYLKIRSYDSHMTDRVYGKIEAEAVDDAMALGGSRHIGSLPRTVASVDWDLNEPWSAHTWYDSPDIAEVIQEVVDRDGWSTSNSLAILYGTRQPGGGNRYFSSYDFGNDGAPKLEVTYRL